MYRQLGDSNSKSNKKILRKLLVVGSASWEMCNLRDVPVEEQARKIKPLDGRFFSNFVGNKNSIRLSALKDLRLTERKTLIKKRIKLYKISCCNNKTHLLEENLLPL